MKVSTIHISKFRGIPSDLTLNFTDLNGKAVSVLIYGDNGSGKSSIVDALEFGLQSRIERSASINNPTRPSVFNQSLPSYTPASVSIRFDDNSQITREAHTEYDEKSKELNLSFHQMLRIRAFKDVQLFLEEMTFCHILLSQPLRSKYTL